MSDMHTYLGDALFNWLKGTTFPSAPANVYAALYNGNPSSGGTEVTGTVGLTRQAVTFGSIAARAMSNSAEVNFGTASGSATVSYVALRDAASAGNLLSYVAITPVSIEASEKVAIASGDLDLTY